nr:immunoglobulin heavy chain junction region [Macaca mulatta]
CARVMGIQLIYFDWW